MRPGDDMAALGNERIRGRGSFMAAIFVDKSRRESPVTPNRALHVRLIGYVSARFVAGLDLTNDKLVLDPTGNAGSWVNRTKRDGDSTVAQRSLRNWSMRRLVEATGAFALGWGLLFSTFPKPVLAMHNGRR